MSMARGQNTDFEGNQFPSNLELDERPIDYRWNGAVDIKIANAINTVSEADLIPL